MSALTHTIRQLTWHQQSVTLDRATVCEAEKQINELLAVLGYLADVEGPVSISKGIVTFEDGTTVDLHATIAQATDTAVQP